MKALDQLTLLHEYVTGGGGHLRPDGTVDQPVNQTRLVSYHQSQSKSLAERETPMLLVKSRSQGMTKAAIERPVKIMLMPGPAEAKPLIEAVESSEKDTVGEAKDWKTLSEDSQINENARRRTIHEMLAASGPVLPKEVSKQIYKDVLHADLDDPYLGLGHILFAHYPFKDSGGP